MKYRFEPEYKTQKLGLIIQQLHSSFQECLWIRQDYLSGKQNNQFTYSLKHCTELHIADTACPLYSYTIYQHKSVGNHYFSFSDSIYPGLSVYI